MPDAEPPRYPAVIREMIGHENDVTNHRLMWRLMVQGLIAKAAVSAGRGRIDRGELRSKPTLQNLKTS